jgi:hypothetical protein
VRSGWTAVAGAIVAAGGCDFLVPLDGLSGATLGDASVPDGPGAGDSSLRADTSADAHAGGSSGGSSSSGSVGADSSAGHDASAGGDASEGGMGYRRQLEVAAVDAVGAGYAVHFSLGTSALVSAGKLRPDLNDLRIVDSVGAELDRVIDPLDSTGQERIWFAVEHSIATGASGTYWLTYGSADAGPAAASGSNVFSLYDNFPTATIGSIWMVLGAPTVAAGAVTLHAWNTSTAPKPDALSADLPTIAGALETVVEVKNPTTVAQPSGEYYWWGFQTGFQETQPWQIWISRGTGSQTEAEQSVPGSGSCSSAACVSTTLPLDASPHWYRVERAPSATRYYRDELQSQSIADANTTASAVMLRNFAPQSDVVISLVRYRPLVDNEPSVVLGPEL